MVQIVPHEFIKPSIRAIEDSINAKYADKVLHQIGLCVGFHSLVNASEGRIGHGDGIVSINVDFRLIVFRPFKGEILMGTIVSSDMTNGIYLSTEFFDDIQVPPSVLPENTIFDPGENLFIWRYREDDNVDEFKDYYFDRAEKCLFRIETEQWHDMTPGQNPEPEPIVEEGENARKIPYAVQASMMHSGTGPKLWWVDTTVTEDGSGEPETFAGP